MVTKLSSVSWICSPHGGEEIGERLTFRRNMTSPFTVSKTKQIKDLEKQAVSCVSLLFHPEHGDDMIFRNTEIRSLHFVSQFTSSIPSLVNIFDYLN